MKLEPITLEKQFKSKPFDFQVTDLEASDWINFECGGFYDGKNYFEFRHLSEFVEFILESKKSLNIFAHFGGGYDFLFIIEALLKENVKILQIIPRGSSILSFRIQGNFKQHTFRDSSAILPFGLKKLSEAFDVETKKGEYDHSLNRKYNEEMSAYLKDDCISLYQVLRKYFDSDLIRKAGAATTIASQAQKILRTYLKKPLFSLNDSVNEFCRLACLGGRTEIFKPLGENIHEYDANSLYPYAMKMNMFPTGQAIGTNHFKKNKLGIYKVKVKAPNLHIPIIGVKHDDKLLFPIGNFETYVTSAEIEFAESYGYKFECISGYWFTSSDYIFKDFISDLYKLRQESLPNSVMNVLTKLIMNSSYGKFSIRTNRENITFDETEHGVKEFRELKIDKEIIKLYTKPVELNTFKNAAIGAFILSYARIHMMKLIQPIAEHVYYTDTDSIFTDIKLESSKELGMLKHEKSYNQVCFLLPKTYIAQNDLNDKKITMKGFDKRKLSHLNLNDFKSALHGEFLIKIKHDKSIAKFKSALRYNKLVMHKNSFTKQIKSKYNKREVNLTLNKTYPLKIN